MTSDSDVEKYLETAEKYAEGMLIEPNPEKVLKFATLAMEAINQVLAVESSGLYALRALRMKERVNRRILSARLAAWYGERTKE